ncbi:MAG: phosphatidate cytidylyltransferase [Acidimicrobiales bacterium]
MEDRDDRPENYTIDADEAVEPNDASDLAEQAASALQVPVGAAEHEPVDSSSQDLTPATASRPPVYGRARIAGVEAGVAAGLLAPTVPAAEAEEVAPAAPAVEVETADTFATDDEIWGDFGAADPSADDALLTPALPDWRDPPTREVPRVLLEHALADPAPTYPGPVWREVEADWDDDDLTFAEIVHEGSSVAEHGLGIDEPDPFAFDFAIGAGTAPARPILLPETGEEGDELAVSPPSAGSAGEEIEPALAPGWEPRHDADSGAGEGFSRRAGRGMHRARASLVERARSGARSARAAATPSSPAGAPSPASPAAPAATAPSLPAHLPAPPPQPAAKRNPVIATVTGLAVGFAVLALFWAGPPVVLGLVTVVLVVAAAECFQALRQARFRPAVLVGLLGVVAVALGGYFTGPQVVPFVGAGVVIATLCWYLFGLTKRAPVANFAATVMGWAWVGLCGSFATLLLDPHVFPDRHGVAYLLGAIVATVAYDVGGYAFGSWIGSRPLAPSVSPNKTFEGLAGGCFAAVAVSVAVVSRMHPWTIAHSLELGLVVAVFAPLGDLAESMIKRDIGVKDMGTLLPAHGGMLDRVDSLLFVLPATYCLVRLFHG